MSKHPGCSSKAHSLGDRSTELPNPARLVLTALASSDTKLLIQYIPKRYEWTFAEVGIDLSGCPKLAYAAFLGRIRYLLSEKALVNIALLTVIVPCIIRSSMTSKTGLRFDSTI